MHHSFVHEFVLYLLVDEAFSDEWQENIVKFLAKQNHANVVFVGGLTEFKRFKEYSDNSEIDYLPCHLSTKAWEYYRVIFDFHGQYGPGADLLLIKSGVFVASTDLGFFARILSHNANIGTISPVTNQGDLFALFDSKQSTISLSLANKLLYRLDDKSLVETAFYYPHLVYWQHKALQDALSRTKSGDDETDLALAASDSGFLHVMSAKFYCKCKTRRGRKIVKRIDKHALSQVIIARHPLTGLKHRMSGLVNSIQKHQIHDSDHAGPTQLHVMHSWGGGLQRWVSDYVNADKSGKNYALKSIGDWGAFGKRLSLYNHPEDEHAIKYWDLYHPIHGTALVHLQYAEIIQSIIYDYGIDVILVSSLIGHSLDILDTNVRTSLILHDYYPFCPAIYIYFSGICRSCDKEYLTQCEGHNPLNFLFKGVSTEQWMLIRKRYISLIKQNEIVLITPSESVGRHFQSLIPEFSDVIFNCIPHGLTSQLSDIRVVQPARRKRIRILVLGKLDEQKGLTIYREIVGEIAKFADLIFLGCGEKGRIFAETDGIIVESFYRPNELSVRLQHYAPDLGLLLSLWPETFSYTLSELMIHAIPTVVSSRGAPLERINNLENGFLIDPEPNQVISLLHELAEKPEKLDKVRNELLTQEFRSASMMVMDYQRLLIRDREDILNSYAMICLSEQPPQPDLSNHQSTVIGEGDYFDVMRQLQNYLVGLVNKVPGIHRYTRKLFTICIKIWIVVPVRFASWYVGRKN